MLKFKQRQQQPPGRNYKWIALSNTTLGSFMSMLNGSSVTIALPVIFRGINLDMVAPENSTYLLWVLVGYMLVQALLVLSLGRIGDIFGRVKMYNLGFVVFTAGSILLSLTWSSGPAGAIELIVFRAVQAVGGALIMANSAAILTDAFPANQRGLALGINGIAFNAGFLMGILVGGFLSELGWRWVFLANVPVGVFGTVWAYIALREIGTVKTSKIDWIGNSTFAIGLIMLLLGITYGTSPSETSIMSWTTPFILTMLIGGVAFLVIFVFVELHVKNPMFRIELFHIRAFAAGNVAQLMSSVSQGGLMLILQMWLQGIWLPLHGYAFEETPLWAGIYILPQTIAFLVSGPIFGRLSDVYGPRFFTTIGLVLSAISFAFFMILPVNFSYTAFAGALFLNGLALGLFASPNMAAVMNSVPAESRGAASGMRAAFVNVGSPLSTGLFFSLLAIGVNSTAPQAILNGLTQSGVSTAIAQNIANQPPNGYISAAFLGINPLGHFLGPAILSSLPAATAELLTSKEFFPQIISLPFQNGLGLVFMFCIVVCIIGAVISWLRGRTVFGVETIEVPEVQKSKQLSADKKS